MAHETHHDSHGHHHIDADTRPTSSTRSAFWFVLILAGLFIAAVNFVGVMSHDEEGGHSEIPPAGAVHEPQKATVNMTLPGEDGLGKDDEHTTQYHVSDSMESNIEGHEQH